MDSTSERGLSSRIVIKPGRPGLALLAVFGLTTFGLWLLLAAASLTSTDVVVFCVILPITTVGVCISGWISIWALRKRASDDPAMIIDEVGLFDNISLGNVGRVRWREIDRVWLAGPNWFRVLCVMPQDVNGYMKGQDGARATLMKFNLHAFGSPIIIPLSALDMEPGDLWFRVNHLSTGPASLTCADLVR